MLEWQNDGELFALCRQELFTAVVGDICDQVGLRRQFLGPQLRPLHTGGKTPIMIGRAMTVLEVNVFEEPTDDMPFGKMLEALDSLQRDEVYVCAGASPRYALLGELMCTAMQVRGAAGAVCAGYVRDVEGILAMNFPVYSHGAFAQDQRGRGIVLDYRVPIEIDDIRIVPGDIIMGDMDGVLVIPQAAEAEIFTQALVKARTEKSVHAALLAGMSATEAFTKYGVL